MPVTEQIPVVAHNGNGVTTVFAYNFKILAEADLEVTVDGVVKTLTTHYSVSGVGSDGGGSVTMVTAPASGTANVVLQRDMTYSRATDYQDNGDLLAATLDDDLDRPVMLLQQIKALLARALRVIGSEVSIAELPALADRASMYLAFDANGDPVATAGTTSDLIATPFAETLLDDGTAAAARATLGVVIGTDVQAFVATASEAEMNAGTETAVRAMSPLRVKQAGDPDITIINFNASGGTYGDVAIDTLTTRVVCVFYAISTNGTSPIIVQLRQGGSGVTHDSSGSNLAAATVATLNTNLGFYACSSPSAATGFSGTMELLATGSGFINSLIVGNCNASRVGATNAFVSAGHCVLGNNTTTLRLTTAGGADGFDDGYLYVYQYKN